MKGEFLKSDIDAANIVTKAQALEPRGEGIKVDYRT
jgi:hypothetical protein